MVHDTVMETFRGSSPLAPDAGRVRRVGRGRRGGPVIVRIPYLTPTGPGSLRRAAPPTSESRQGDSTAWDSPAAGHAEPQTDLLPEPFRRVSTVEHALRQLRREAAPVTTHTLRNLVILVAILIAATGLTIWMTQGAATRDPSSGPASVQRSSAEMPLKNGNWNSFDLDGPGTSDLQDRWAWGTAATSTGPPQRAPAIDSWPPDRASGSAVPWPQGRIAGEASSSFPVRLGAYPQGPPQQGPHARAQTPVANLNHIEPPPLRR